MQIIAIKFHKLLYNCKIIPLSWRLLNQTHSIWFRFYLKSQGPISK